MSDIWMPTARPGAYRLPRRGAATSAASRSWKHDMAMIAVASVVAGGVVLGMATGTGTVTQVAAYAALAIGLASPATGLLILCLLAPLKTPLGAVPPPQLNMLLVGAMLFGLVLRLPLERPRLRVGAPLAMLVALYLYVALQQVPDMLGGWSGDRGYLVGSLFIQVSSGLMLLVVSLVVLRDRSPYVFLAGLLTAAVVVALLGVLSFEQTVGGPLANLLGNPEDTSRATGSFGDPNYYGLFLALATTTGIALLTEARRRSIALVLGGVSLVLLTGMLVSLSRGAMLSLGAAVIAMAAARSRRAGLVTVGVGLLVLFVIYPLFVDWRLTNLTGSASAASVQLQDDSDSGRLTGVLAGVELWLSAPVFGVGFGQYSYAVVETGISSIRVASHNWYMNLLGEQGLLGIGLWLAVMAMVAKGVLERARPARTVGIGVLTGLAVGMLFAEVPMSFQTVALPIVVLGAVLVSDWSVSGRRREPGPGPWQPGGPMLERT